jgi:hypothetical protein
MGRVDLADFQNDVEPRVEVELVATEAERDQDSGQAGGEHLLSRLAGYPAGLLRCRRART